MKLSLTKHAAINNIALATGYGLRWLEDLEDHTPGKINTALEVLAHAGACRMCREVIKDSVDTATILEMILDFPDASALEKRLVSLFTDSLTSYDGILTVWVAGFVSRDSGGFEWRKSREAVESVVAQWKAEDSPEDAEFFQYQVRPVFLADLGLTGNCTPDAITEAMDRNGHFWEPNGGAGITV